MAGRNAGPSRCLWNYFSEHIAAVVLVLEWFRPFYMGLYRAREGGGHWAVGYVEVRLGRGLFQIR